MKRRVAAVLMGVLVTTGLFATKKSKTEDYDLTIKVIKSDTGKVTVDNPNVGACDQANYSAYCKYAATEFMQSRMVVEGDDKVFNITCTVENRWSDCVSLPVGDTFKARMDKRGLYILYKGSDGKEHKQLYEVLYAGAALKSEAASAGSAAKPAVTAPPKSNAVASAPAATEAAVAAIPDAPEVVASPASNVAIPPGKVRCNFSSRPSGAEITLDGAYVGNTPSSIGVTPGPHQIGMSLPGFAAWNRKLQVLSGSDLSVSATMQKAQ